MIIHGDGALPPRKQAADFIRKTRFRWIWARSYRSYNETEEEQKARVEILRVEFADEIARALATGKQFPKSTNSMAWAEWRPVWGEIFRKGGIRI
jgi:hypothetical protein